MQLVVRGRDGNSATYDILDDSGVVIRSVSRDVSLELSKARLTHKSLADVLAEAESAVPALLEPKPVDFKASGVTVLQLDNAAETGPAILPHEHPFMEHDHALPEHTHVHSHEDINTRIGKLREDVNVDNSLLAERIEHHSHPEHSHEEIWTRTRELTNAVKAQQEHSHPVPVMPVHDHPLPPHEHSTSPHSHDEYAGRVHVHEDAPLHGHAASDLRLEELEAIAFRWRDWEGKDAAPHEHDYAAASHEHEVVPHRHASMDGLVEEVAGLTERVNVHGHPHTHDDLRGELGQLVRKVTDLGRADVKEHSHAIPAHEHEASPHSHAQLEQSVNSLQSAIDLAAKHEHPHSHGDAITRAEYQGLREMLDTLAQALDALTNRVALHNHAVEPHEHTTYHEHPELKLELADHIKAVQRHANWEVVAEQEVAGRTQLVVREVK
jgi:hypothetical protein